MSFTHRRRARRAGLEQIAVVLTTPFTKSLASRAGSPHHQQDPTDLWQQGQQDEAEHGKVFRRRPHHAAGDPRDQLDCCVGLGVGRLPDRLVIAASRSWRRSATKASRSRQNFPTPPLHSRSRAAMASVSAAWAVVTAGVTRDARTSVTSLMLVEAKPMPAVTAKTNVTNQTPSQRARWPADRCAIARRRWRAKRGQPDQQPRRRPGRAIQPSHSTRAIAQTNR